MRIAFLANKHLTILQRETARHLERGGHTVFWLSPSMRWSRWLRRNGVEEERLLDLAAGWLEHKRAGGAAGGADDFWTEAARHGLDATAIAGMDRALRRRPPEYARRYLDYAAPAIGQFIDDHALDVCFGEATWAWEIVTWVQCRARAVPCLFPSTVRIPANRFALFDSYTHCLHAPAEPSAADREWARSFLAAYRARPEPPAYAHRAMSVFVPRRHWFRELAVSLFDPWLNAGDETNWPLWYRIGYRLRRAAYGAMARFQNFGRVAPATPYVIFFLQHQPEAAVDVFGAPFADQGRFIETIHGRLPATHRLVIKEHPAGIGDRSPAWYRRVARLPRTDLIDAGVRSFDLIRGADLVTTVSGTVAYEAALLGRPAAAGAAIYFAPILSATGDPAAWPWAHLLSSAGGDRETDGLVTFLATVRASSYPGTPADPVSREIFADQSDPTAHLVAGIDAFLRTL